MPDRRCTCCPHGAILIVPSFLVFIATVFTWIFTFDCRFYVVKGLDHIDLAYEYRNYWHDEVEMYFGLWTVEQFATSSTDGSTCYTYAEHNSLDKSDLDGAMKFGRTTSLLAALMSLPTLAFVFLPSCIAFNRVWIRILSSTLLFLSVLCLFTLSAMASDFCQDAPECEIDVDGTLCIFAFLAWLVAGLVALFLRDDPHLTGQHQPASAPGQIVEMARASSDPAKTEVVEETNNADGTVTKVTTTIESHADGSKTVTKTTEVSPPEATAVAY